MRQSSRRSYTERILRSLVEIEADLDADVSVDALARLANFSPFHFRRIFRAMVDESPASYVRRLRLERAVHELRTTDRTIGRIASDAGYSTHESFIRAFRSEFRTTPSAHRRAAQARSNGDRRPENVLVSEDVKRLSPNDVALPREAGPVARFERVPPVTVAFIRHVGPYDQVPLVFDRLLSWARRQGPPNRALLVLGAAHDDPTITPPERLRFDCCVEMDRRVTTEYDIGLEVLGGGEYASATHRGPFERLAETYAWLGGEWLPAQGRSIRRAPCLEIYLTDPERTAPDEMLTDVLIPVSRR